MPIRDTAYRLARQSRRVKICDLVGLSVEQIKRVELQPHAVVETVAGPRVEYQRTQRTHAVVLDQRTRAEIAPAQRAEPAGISAERHAPAGNPGWRAGNAVAGRVEIGEPGARIGDIEIERHPRLDFVLIGPFDAHAAAGPARLGRAGVADEQQFGFEVEHEQRQRTSEIFNCPGADADLGAPGAHEQGDAIEQRDLVIGIDGDGRSADVVGVQAIARIAVKFGLEPGAENDTGLWTRHGSPGVTGILRRIAQNTTREIILPQANGGAQPVGPARHGICPYADAAFARIILANG